MAARIAKEAPGERRESQVRARLAAGCSATGPRTAICARELRFSIGRPRFSASDRSSQTEPASNGRGRSRRALAQLCQALLISNGFLYVD